MRSSSTLSLVTYRNNAEELVCTDCTNKFFCSFDGLKKIETCGACPEMATCQTIAAIISSNEEARENLRRKGE